MKKLITLLILLVSCLTLDAQDFMKVTGVVVNASGAPIAGATITAVGTKVSAKTGSNGSFELMIPNTVRYIRVQKSMYLAKNVAVHSSLQIVLEVDKAAAEKVAAEKEKAAEKARLAAEKAKAEEEARVRAAAEARAKAIRDSLALVEQVRLEAEARARAAAEAREKAIRDSLAFVEKTRLEAEARVQAAKEARQKAVRDSLAAIEARASFVRDSIAAAEVRAIFVRDSIALALEQQKKDAIKTANDQYNQSYKNKGIENTLEIGYAYQLAKGVIRYQYSGYRSVSALHPVFVDYTLGYRFNRVLSLGVGAGFLYNLKGIVIVNDQIWGADKEWEARRFDIPVFLDVKARFSRKSVRPLIDCKGGWYPMTGVFFVDTGVGLEFRTSRQTALNVTASIRTTPFFEVDNLDTNRADIHYSPCWSPSIRLGFAF